MTRPPSPPRNPSGAIHPSVFLLTWVGAALVLQWVAPWSIPDAPPVAAAGTATTFVAVLLFVWAVVTCRRGGTTLEHGRPTTALVTGGPFRFSRNPMYVALVLLLLGLSIEYHNGWAAAGAAVFALAVHRFTVLREERYLEALFGDEFRLYRLRVRRWV